MLTSPPFLFKDVNEQSLASERYFMSEEAEKNFQAELVYQI